MQASQLQHPKAYLPFKIRPTVLKAATLPLAALTSVFALYKDLALPDPWNLRQDTDAPLPLVIYGASTAIGTFAVRLARRGNVHPIIGITSASSRLVLDLMGDGVSKYGDSVVDYR